MKTLQITEANAKKLYKDATPVKIQNKNIL